MSGPREIDKDILAYLQEQDIRVIAGYCPFMFLENSAFFHRIHGFIWKVIGLYPK